MMVGVFFELVDIQNIILKKMKIERRDVYSFLIAVFVVTITSIVQMENPIPDQPQIPIISSIFNADNFAFLQQD